MAIQEFIIGPQNYFEAGYFDGDYTLPNVSKSFLECDVDKIRGGRVVTGEYFLDNYIDGTYYHNNSIIAELVCDGKIVQVATVSLQGYYAEGYYSPGYYQTRGSFFVLTADLTAVAQTLEASATLSSAFTQTAQVGKVQSASASISAAFTQTTAFDKLRGIILSAFSQAAIAIEVSRIRDNNAQVSSVFSVATDGRRFRDLASAEDALFTFSVVNQRSRAFIFETQAAFSLTGVNSRTRRLTASITSTATLACTISHIEGADIIVNGFAALQAIPDNRTRDISASLSSSSSLTVLNTRVKFNSSSMIFFGFFTAENRRIRLISKTLTAVTALTAVSEKYKTFGSTTLSAAFAFSSSGIRAPRDNEYSLRNDRGLLHLDSATPVDVFGGTITNGGYTSVAGKFGNAGGYPVSGPSVLTNGSTYTDLFGQDSWTIDFWFKPIDMSSSSTYRSMGIVALSNRTPAAGDLDVDTMIGYTQTSLLTSGQVTGNFYLGAYFGPIALTNSVAYTISGGVATTYKHIAVTYKKNYFSYVDDQNYSPPLYFYNLTAKIYIDGVLSANYTGINNSSNYATTSNSLYLMPSIQNMPASDGTGTYTRTRSFSGFIDEFRFTPGILYTANFTPATAAYNPNPYFDQAAALIEPRASLTATALIVQFGTAVLASSATASIIPNRIRPGSSSATARFIQLTVPTRTASNVTGNFVITATQTATVSRARLASADLSSAVTVTATNNRIRFSSSAMSAQCSMTIEAKTIGSLRTDLSVTFTQSTVNDRIRYATPQLDAIATNLTAAFRNATGTVLLESVTAMSIIAQKITVQPITLSSAFTQSTVVKRFRDNSSSMAAQATQTVIGERIQAAGSTMSAIFSISANTANSKTTRVSAQMQSTVTAVTINRRNRSTSASMSVPTTLVINNQVLRLASASMISVSETIFIITKVVRITAVLQSQGFQFTIGDAFNIDAYNQLTIAQETRGLLILPESRLITIEQETRVNII